MKKYGLSAFGVILFFFSTIAQSWQRVQLVPYSLGATGYGEAVNFKDTVIVMGYDGCIYHTNDFFQTWYVDSAHKNSQPEAMSFASREVGYITSTYAQGGMFKTTDGGNIWSPLPVGPLTGVSIGDVLLFVNPDSGYAAHSIDYRFNIIRDGGFSGTTIGPIDAACQKIFRICSTNDSTLFIICNDWPTLGPAYFGFTHIFKSVNSGFNWQQIRVFNNQRYFNDLHFLDDSIAIVVSNQIILKTTDGGYTFDTVMLSNDNYDTFGSNLRADAISFVSHDTGFVAFAGGRVYKTVDAGDTWIKTDFAFDTSDHSNVIFCIRAISSYKVMVGCANGNIYKTEIGGGVWSDIKETAQETKLLLYPNPATNHITLTTTAALHNPAVTITTSTGSVVMQTTLTNPNKNELDISPLPAGLYFLSLYSEGERVVRRFVKTNN